MNLYVVTYPEPHWYSLKIVLVAAETKEKAEKIVRDELKQLSYANGKIESWWACEWVASLVEVQEGIVNMFQGRY